MGAQADAELKASKAEAEATANAIQDANSKASAQRVEYPPTPSWKPKSWNEVRDDPRLFKCPLAGPSKEDAEQAH